MTDSVDVILAAIRGGQLTDSDGEKIAQAFRTRRVSEVQHLQDAIALTGDEVQDMRALATATADMLGAFDERVQRRLIEFYTDTDQQPMLLLAVSNLLPTMQVGG